MKLYCGNCDRPVTSDIYDAFVFCGVVTCVDCINERKQQLKEYEQALSFYADPHTYTAIGFLPDPPCGALLEDFSQTYLGLKPGLRARTVLGVEDELKTCKQNDSTVEVE